MKTFLTLFVLLFSSLVFAESISDFEIEGISVGDSALDFFSEKQIKENEWDYYDDKTFTPVQNDKLPFFTTYDAVDFHYKTGDKEYIIYGLTGVLYFKNNIKECYPKMDEIFENLSDLFTNANILDKMVTSAPWDKNTTKTDAVFELDSGSVTVACYDYSEEDGNMDNLSVELFTNELRYWRRDKAYNQ